MMPDGKNPFYPYKMLEKKWVLVQIRTGSEYEGILEDWGPFYITLNHDEERILISREDGNIVSVRTKSNSAPPTKTFAPGRSRSNAESGSKIQG